MDFMARTGLESEAPMVTPARSESPMAMHRRSVGSDWKISPALPGGLDPFGTDDHADASLRQLISDWVRVEISKADAVRADVARAGQVRAQAAKAGGIDVKVVEADLDALVLSGKLRRVRRAGFERLELVSS